MDIYVSSLTQNDVYDYEIYVSADNSQSNNLDTWFQQLTSSNIHNIKKGDIIKLIINPDDSTTPLYIDKDYFPAYLIAKSSYSIPGTISDYVRRKLRIPRSNNPENGKLFVDMTNNDTEENRVNIWDTCNSALNNANGMPWMFETKGVVTDYISFQWIDGYSETGSFKLVLPSTDENIELFKTNRYLSIHESDKKMIIEKTTLNGNFLSDGFMLQVSGRSLESILDRRVAFPGMDLDTEKCKADDGLLFALYSVVDEYFINPGSTAQISNDGTKYFYYPERKIPFFEIPKEEERSSYIKREFNASINKNIIKNNILEFITENCKNNNLGFKILPYSKYDNSKCVSWRFILYTGQDKSYNRSSKSSPLIVFSPILNNVKTISTTVDSSNYKNIVFCGVSKDAEGFIDLTNTPTQMTELLNIKTPSLVTTLKDKVVSNLNNNPVTCTGVLFLATAANLTDKSYTATVRNFEIIGFDTRQQRESFIINNLGIPQDGFELYGTASETNNKYIFKQYPSKPITKALAAYINVIFYKTGGEDISTTKTGKFNLANIDTHSDTEISFKLSTQFGWLTPTILKEATNGANQLNESNWSGIGTVISTITKKGILAWFKTFDVYTGGGVNRTKWLCQVYDRSNNMDGLDRKEVFVEQESDNDNEWDTSAINAWRSSTTLITTAAYNDEESDEEINKKLYESANKQSGNYNVVREVDADVDTYSFIYKTDYDLGDIVQVDDGHGNMDTYYISSCVVTNDTTDGESVIPKFTKYDVIPSAYIQIQYLRVANMILPVRYCPQENIINANEDLNYGEYQPDFGPVKNPTQPSNPSFDYFGYISGILKERRSKWTEFEMKAVYNRYNNNPLTSSFAMLSAIGYLSINSSLTPYLLICSTTKYPLRLGMVTGGSAYFDGNSDPYTHTPTIYQFIGDYIKAPSTSSICSVPGIGIKWEQSASTVTPNNAIDINFYGYDYSYRNVTTFFLNKPIEEKSSRLNVEKYGPDERLLQYSISYVGYDYSYNRLAKRPMFQFAFPIDFEHWRQGGGSYYVQTSEWDYGHDQVSDIWNQSNNTYEGNPWNRFKWHVDDYNVYVDKTAMAYSDIDHSFKHISLTSESTPHASLGLFSGEGAFGQIPFNMSSTDENDILNNSAYRYMILGGMAYKNYYDSNIVWHGDSNGYGDTKNGLYLTGFKVYEYDSVYRIYRYSTYKLNNDDQLVNTWLLGWDRIYPGSGDLPENNRFRGAQAACEWVNISSKHLAHDYVPVKYVDYGDKKLDNTEIYGLYDKVEQKFIPVNFCPDPTVFGESTNSHAVFIDAGGEVPKY